MKATEQYFPVVLFIMLYKVALTVESVDEILKCDYSNESYWAVLSFGAVYYAAQADSNNECEEAPCAWPFSETNWAVNFNVVTIVFSINLLPSIYSFTYLITYLLNILFIHLLIYVVENISFLT